MRTIFKYDANNFMKNEINEMSNKRRKKIFKLMNLLGEFSLTTNLYVDCSEMDDNVKIITYDKDGSKITFYARSINKDLEDLVFIDEFKHSEAYSIKKDKLNIKNFENLKFGDVYYINNGIVIINKEEIEIEFNDGTTFVAKIVGENNDYISKFNINLFINKLNEYENLNFVDFKNILLDFVINPMIKLECYKNKELHDSLELNNNEFYQEFSVKHSLQRIKK